MAFTSSLLEHLGLGPSILESSCHAVRSPSHRLGYVKMLWLTARAELPSKSQQHPLAMWTSILDFPTSQSPRSVQRQLTLHRAEEPFG